MPRRIIRRNVASVVHDIDSLPSLHELKNNYNEQIKNKQIKIKNLSTLGDHPRFAFVDPSLGYLSPPDLLHLTTRLTCGGFACNGAGATNSTFHDCRTCSMAFTNMGGWFSGAA